jgi:hypothetical protein
MGNILLALAFKPGLINEIGFSVSVKFIIEVKTLLLAQGFNSN